MTVAPRPGQSRVPMWALVVAAATFLEQLDGTIVVTALPAMARDFHTVAPQMTVVATAYLVAVAAFIPLGAWMAGRWGHARIFIIATLLFAASSVLASVSGTLLVLVCARVLQGVAGAMMVPVGRLIVLRSGGREQLLRLVALITWPALIAPVVAPLVGAVIATTVGWRWIFLINLPLAVIVAIVSARVLPAATEEREAGLDWRGLVGTTVAALALTAGLETLAVGGPFTGVWGVLLVVCGAAIGWVTVRHLLRFDTPLFDLQVFRLVTFRVANVYGAAFRLAVTSAPFVLPLLLQGPLGLSPITSGAIVAALFLGNVAIKPATTPLLRRYSFRGVTVVAALAVAVCFVVFAGLRAGAPLAVLATVAFVSGVARSVGFTAFNTVQFADVPSAQLRSANALSATVQQISTAFGIAICALIIELLLPFGQGAYDAAFMFLAAICAAAAWGMTSLPATAADHVRVRERG